MIVDYRTKVTAKRDSIQIPANTKFASIRFGFGGSEGVTSKGKNYLLIKKNASLRLEENVRIAEGFSLRIENGSTLRIGKNFYANKNLFISCSNGIDIEDQVLVGWNVEIRDSDGHNVYYSDKNTTSYKQVKIGRHVWIAAYSLIMGNTEIGNESVVSIRSITNKKYEDHCLLAGSPAREIRKIEYWKN